MVSKSMFSVEEWGVLRDAPDWVNVALASADNPFAVGNKIRESLGYKKAVSNRQSGSVLIREVLADTTKPAKEVKGANLAEALKALAEVNKILEQKKVDIQEADKFRDFLVEVGYSVAESAAEGLMGLGKKVSKKEAEVMEKVEAALKATAADKKARAEAEVQAQAKAKADADAKAKADAAAKAKAEADAKAKAAADAKAKVDAEAKAKAEADAKIKAEVDAKVKAELEAKARAEAGAKARAEIEAKVAQQKEEALAKAKAAEEAAKAKAAEEAAKVAEAVKAKAAEEAAKAAALAAAKPKFLADHTVVSGESLSLLSKKYYGSIAQDKWMLIYEANKAIIGDNPNMIRVGQVLKIPVLPS